MTKSCMEKLGREKKFHNLPHIACLKEQFASRDDSEDMMNIFQDKNRASYPHFLLHCQHSPIFSCSFLMGNQFPVIHKEHAFFFSKSGQWCHWLRLHGQYLFRQIEIILIRESNLTYMDTKKKESNKDVCLCSPSI